MDDLKRPVSPGLIIASGSIAFLVASLLRDVSIAYFFGGVGYVDLFFVFFGIFEFAQIFCRQTEGGILPHLNSVAGKSMKTLFDSLKSYWVSRVFLGTAIVSVLLSLIVYSESVSTFYYVLNGLSIAVAITFFLASGFNCTLSIWMGDWRWYAFQLPSIALVWTLCFTALKILGYEKIALPVGLIAACFAFWFVQRLYMRSGSDGPRQESMGAIPPEMNRSLALITFDALLTVGMIRLLERTVVFGMGEGVVTSLAFSARLSFIVWAMFLPAFSLPLFTQISKNNNEDFRNRVRDKIKDAFLVITLAYGVVIPLLPLMSEMLFGHGNFSAENLKVTSDTIAVYSLAFFGGIFTDILGRIFWANRESLLRLKLQGASLIVYAIVLTALVRLDAGYMSAPVAWVAYWIFNGLLHTLVARKKGYVAIGLKDAVWFFLIAALGGLLAYAGMIVLNISSREFGSLAGFAVTAILLSLAGSVMLVSIMGKAKVFELIRSGRPA